MPTTEPTGCPHRNQGLFSDHYLNVTMPGRPDWQALASEAEATMAKVSHILEAYAPSQNEAQTEEDLVRPSPRTGRRAKPSRNSLKNRLSNLVNEACNHTP